MGSHPFGGGSQTVTQTGPVAEAQAGLTRALGALEVAGMQFLGREVDRLIPMTQGIQMSEAESALPGATAAAYNPLAQGLTQGANQLVSQSREGLAPEGVGAMRAAVQRALGRGESPMTAAMRNLGSVASAPVPAFGQEAGRLGTAGEALTGGPLDTAAVLDPLQRAFTQTIAPEIRGAAMRAGVPGGGGEQDLMSRAAGDFGRQAAVGLSQQELARRGQGLQGLQQSGNLLQSMINAEQSRRTLGISGEQVGGQFELGQAEQELGRLGLASRTGESGTRLDLARRGEGLQEVLGAGRLGGAAADAAMMSPTAAATLGSATRNLGIQRETMPLNLAIQAMSGLPNLGAFSTGTTSTSRPSVGANIGGSIGAATLLPSMLMGADNPGILGLLGLAK